MDYRVRNLILISVGFLQFADLKLQIASTSCKFFHTPRIFRIRFRAAYNQQLAS
jgi:hypothetical protein